MKHTTVVLAALIAASPMIPAQADEMMAGKKGLTFAGGAAAGAALGGPAGLFIGALTGAWFAEQVEDAAELDPALQQLRQSETELAAVRDENEMLDIALQQAQQSYEQYATLVMEQLQLEMLFRTGSSELTGAGSQRLQGLAQFLAQNPLVSVQLDGYADPRGDADYNLALSTRRAEQVADAMRAAGVEDSRISVRSHGATAATAVEGDYDAYALERKVSIQLEPTPAAGIASVD